MMSVLPKEPKLKALTKEWYERLKEEGFEDIEDIESGREYLKSWHSSHFGKIKDSSRQEAQAEYFDRCMEYLHTCVWENKHEQRIWELHASGISICGIMEQTHEKHCRVYAVIRKHVGLAFK